MAVTYAPMELTLSTQPRVFPAASTRHLRQTDSHAPVMPPLNSTTTRVYSAEAISTTIMAASHVPITPPHLETWENWEWRRVIATQGTTSVSTSASPAHQALMRTKASVSRVELGLSAPKPVNLLTRVSVMQHSVNSSYLTVTALELARWSQNLVQCVSWGITNHMYLRLVTPTRVFNVRYTLIKINLARPYALIATPPA